MDWINVYIFVHFFIPANSVSLNKTYVNLEFISPGTSASLSSAQTWCKQHGSTLAEITSENIWILTQRIAREFKLNSRTLILNAEGRELTNWQWITGETFKDEGNYFSLMDDTRMYAHISTQSRYSTQISIVGSSPDCTGGSCNHGYVCELDSDSSCNINSVQINGTCYVFHHKKFLTWFEAFHECEKNNGRLATFRDIKTEEKKIAAELEYGNKYWIGLQRFEWRWADSGKLITYAKWNTLHPHQSDSCMCADLGTNKWYSSNQCTNADFKFVCIRDTTKCVSNPCQNGASCIGSINNHTCLCPPEFTDTGSKCQSYSNQTVEPHADSNTQIIIISIVIVVLVFMISIMFANIYNRIYKIRKMNDASKYETSMNSVSQYAVLNACDNPRDGSQTPIPGSAIYGQVVSSQNDDQRNTVTSSSLVYADLEFSPQIMQVETYSDTKPKTQPPSFCTGPMGDVYAMVEK